jgi:hypothetical protein
MHAHCDRSVWIKSRSRFYEALDHTEGWDPFHTNIYESIYASQVNVYVCRLLFIDIIHITVL